MKNIVALFVFTFASTLAWANSYTCAQMVYKDGWLRKYELLGNTWGANTKKTGLTSSLVGSSIEKTTSSLDPGVSTGNTMSSLQYTSSWGECSMLEYEITWNMREQYIEQNRDEITKQIAVGEGHHVDSLAFVSGCHNIDAQTWSRSLQQNTAEFYDAKSSSAFADKLQSIIESNPSLKANCHLAARS